MEGLFLDRLGSQEDAMAIFKRFFSSSEAYREYCGNTIREWDKVPVIKKKDFYGRHPWQQLVPKESLPDIYAITRSSGSTNPDGSSKGFFWPKLKSMDLPSAAQSQKLLLDVLQLAKHRTLFIVGLSLGSWAGGEEFSFLFKSVAIRAPFPLTVFSPGNQHLEIIEVIEKFESAYSQILIAVCPSAIFYLEQLANSRGAKIPWEKVAFLVTGEPFPEELRSNLSQRGFAKNLAIPPVLSAYGSADTGFLGFESTPLVSIRKALNDDPALAAACGFPARAIPNLVHANVHGNFYECINDELVITQWQGVPLVRYNLQDKVKFLSWKKLCELAADGDSSRAQYFQAISAMPLPDVISVSGRTEGCIFLCGSNIFETMLQEVILHSDLGRISTGVFHAWTSLESGQQILNIQVELKVDEAPPTENALELIYRECVAALGKQQPEFADDYEKFYRPFESSGRKVLKFYFSEYPYLTDHKNFAGRVKRKIFIDGGPI